MKVFKIRMDELIIGAVLGSILFGMIGFMWGEETSNHESKYHKDIPVSLAMKSSLIDFAEIDPKLALEVKTWILNHPKTTVKEYYDEFNKLDKLSYNYINMFEVKSFMAKNN